jgi:acyl-[acyl-carrier-protein] desaturase
MPGHGIPGFARKSVQIALAGIYDLDLHLNEVVSPVLRAWGIFEMTGLSGAAEAQRARIAALVERMSLDVARFTEKREAHFDRLTTRGIEFLRLS